MNGKSNCDRRRIIPLLCVGIVIGITGFFVGRVSIQPNAAPLSVSGPPVRETQLRTNSETENLSSDKTNPVQLTSAVSPEQIWQKLMAATATPARNAALADALEKLATADPGRALALAQAEGNLKLREQLLQAALHGWARNSPLEAANWVLAQPDSGRRDVELATVFAGAAAANPQSAVATAKTLIQQDPSGAISCGSRLIDALCESGNFSTAADFAANSDTNGRNSWMGQAFSKWALYQPQEAVQAAQAFTDPDIRNQALHGVVGGWADADPAGLVQYLAQFPAGADRGDMLGQALKSWTQNDPVAAANWMNNNNGFGPDLDQGAARVATMPLLPTQTALAWAEGIGDPQLRSATLANVLRDWIYDDPSAAQNYFQGTTNLLTADRQQISEVISQRKLSMLAQ
jgi:hypothetical protein